MIRKALFLDRDGVINVDAGYVHSAEQTQWIPGIFELCRAARDLGYALVVVTNQAGIARGYYDEAQFAAHSAWLLGQFALRGLKLAAIYHCPHHPTEGIGELRRECDCRKPRPGMILQAQRELDIDLSASALLGDKDSDLEAGRAAGVAHCLRLGMAELATGPGAAMADAIAWLQSLEPSA